MSATSSVDPGCWSRSAVCYGASARIMTESSGTKTQSARGKQRAMGASTRQQKRRLPPLGLPSLGEPRSAASKSKSDCRGRRAGGQLTLAAARAASVCGCWSQDGRIKNSHTHTHTHPTRCSLQMLHGNLVLHRKQQSQKEATRVPTRAAARPPRQRRPQRLQRQRQLCSKPLPTCHMLTCKGLDLTCQRVVIYKAHGPPTPPAVYHSCRNASRPPPVNARRETAHPAAHCSGLWPCS
jgi:hypothetical protein